MRSIAPLVLSLLVGCGAAIASHSTAPRVAPSEMPPVDPADTQAFAQAMNAFGLDVWEGLRTSGLDGNLAISPASLATALAMTYGGARGRTETAMGRALHVSAPNATMQAAGALVTGWNDPSRTSYELAVANRLFGEREYRFAPAYLAATRDHFGAELERLDFLGDASGARVRINGWVAERTHDRIRDLLPSGAITEDTRLVLVNAVYFHGQWQETFDRALTVDAPFAARGVESVSVPTMQRTGGRYGEDEGVQLLELPYTGDELAMMFVLPRDAAGLASIEERLDSELVAQWGHQLHESADVEVRLPRFRIETASLALREVLVALGMGPAFDDSADFSAMSETGAHDLAISDVFHRVFVELNEEGTEAAAATAVVMLTDSVQEEPPHFVADHPFLFFLRDTRTGAILFAGRVVDSR